MTYTQRYMHLKYVSGGDDFTLLDNRKGSLDEGD